MRSVGDGHDPDHCTGPVNTARGGLSKRKLFGMPVPVLVYGSTDNEQAQDVCNATSRDGELVTASIRHS